MTNLIKIVALTGGIRTPSTRFRVRQHIRPLAGHGLHVKELIPRFGESCGLPSPFKQASRIPALFQSRDADLIWISRDLVKGYPSFERCLKRPRVLDVDDAIWLSRPFGSPAQPWIARGMDAVIAGNQYLADYYSQFCKIVHVVPTAIDLDRYSMRSPETQTGDKFVIVWTGLATNYRFLEPLASVLGRFLHDHPDATLRLVANRPWEQDSLPAGQVEFLPWSPEIEATALHAGSVGIMPLADTKWTRGKCSFKMLQYMAVGLPVIASPVGMNRDVLDQGEVGLPATEPDDWYNALKTLYQDHSLRDKMGRAGRKVIETTYSTTLISARLAEIFKEMIASSGRTSH